jgi:hypothetical protein
VRHDRQPFLRVSAKAPHVWRRSRVARAVQYDEHTLAAPHGIDRCRDRRSFVARHNEIDG